MLELLTGIEPVIFPYQRNVFPLSPQELIYFLDLRDDEESIDAFLAFAALLLAFKGFIFCVFVSTFFLTEHIGQ